MNTIKKIVSLAIICLSSLIFGSRYVQAASDASPVLTLDGQTMKMEVGDILDLHDYLLPYISDFDDLSWIIEENNVIYFVEDALKIYVLRDGTIDVAVKNSDDSLQSSFTIEVDKVNVYPEGNFEEYELDTTWEITNDIHYNWRLYTGNAPVTDSQIVKVEDVERDGKTSRVIHASHSEVNYSTLYYRIPVPGPGCYYVEYDAKGEDLSNNIYARINLNETSMTQTTSMKGTFEWQTFTSNLVESYLFRDQYVIRVELYGANFSGDVWWDNVGIYPAISADYLGFHLNTEIVSVSVDEEYQVVPIVDPSSIIDFGFNFSIEDESIATVNEKGVVKGLKNGYTKLTVVDEQCKMQKQIYVIVGGAPEFTVSDINIVATEDTSAEYTVEVTGNENPIKLFYYTEPYYGNYYIKDDTIIVYSPNKNYTSANINIELPYMSDLFNVIVYEQDRGFKIVKAYASTIAEADAVSVVDFWHTTPKNNKLYDGYLQVVSPDIESQIPELTESSLQGSPRDFKIGAYADVITTLTDGNLSGTTQEGGTITILNDGQAQLIQDRYYTALKTLIFGASFEYTPKEGFIGYDHFDVLITNGDKETRFTATVYVSPSTEDFKFTETDFSGVYVIGNDEWLEETRQAYKNGDKYITTWVNYYQELFKVFNPVGVPAKARTPMEQLATLYQVTKDKKYAEMAWQQMNEITKDNTFDGGDGTKRASWGQSSNGFLDAAMVTYSVAFSYNLIYDSLNESQKLQVVRALYEEGFYWFENIVNPNVLLHGNNHNLLINCNLAIAALSVMSYQGEIDVKVDGLETKINVKEMASNVVSHAYALLQIALVHYSPSGGFPEGPSYSYYGHRNIISLLSTLKNIYGGNSFEELYDFGLTNVMGIVNYPAYTLYTSAPNYDTFYYNEGGYSLNQPGLLWYARMDDKYIPYTLLNKMAFEQESYSSMSLLWYKPGSFDNLDISNVRPLDYLLEVHEIASFRNGFGDEYGIFTALKGFNPTSNLFTHKSLDSGTFEIVAYGEKFIENFSNEDYSLNVPPGYWDMALGRWNYYKKQTQGHNAIVFNPADNPTIQQDPNAKSPIYVFKSNSDGGYAIVELTDVYPNDVMNYQRGLMLSENRSVITVQDEFKLRKESELYWAAHTKANIEIINDKLAVLTLNGKKLYAHINSEIGKFSTMPAVPLPGTSGEYFNLKNDGVNKLIIYEKDIYEGTISVTFTPTMEEIKDVKHYDVIPLSEWEIGEVQSTDIRVDDISFDALTGNKYKYEFIPYQYSYLVHLDASVQVVPELKVEYDKAKYDVVVENAKKFADLSYVHVTDKATGIKKTYQYRFLTNIFVDGYDGFTNHKVENVTGTTENLDYLIDNDKKTVWSAYGRNEVIFELKEPVKITHVGIRFAGGATYQYYFDIYAGNKLDDLDIVYFAGQNQNEIGDEIYTLGDVEAKYVKIVFKGNNDTNETSVSRVNFYENYIEPIEEPIIETPTSKLPLILSLSISGVAIIGVAIFILIKKKPV